MKKIIWKLDYLREGSVYTADTELWEYLCYENERCRSCTLETFVHVLSAVRLLIL